MNMRNGVWKPEITVNFWKVSGFLYIASFCAVAVIGDLILRGVSDQGFLVDGWSFVWMIFVLAAMGIGSVIMGRILWDHEQKTSIQGFVIAAVIVAVVISGLFTYDVSYITGKFAAVDRNGEVTCETNSHWINPFNVKAIHRFDDNVTVNQSVNGNDVTVSIAISQNGTMLYEQFGTQADLTAHVRRVVKNDTQGKFRFLLK